MTEGSDKGDLEGRQVEAFEPLPGDLLLGARRARGLSTAKVAESLNLDESVILALEENRFESLGAPVFARGHLRKYARLLALDTDAVMRAYDAIATEQSAAALAVTPTVEKSSTPVAGQRTLWLVSLLAVVALAMVIWRLLSNGESETEAPASGQETPVSVPAADTPATDAPSVVAATPEARPDVTDEPAAEDTEPVQPAQETEAAPVETPAATETQPAARLVFSFREDSWLDVRDARGRRLAYELGRRGTRRTVTGEGPFQISLGNWAGVSITYADEPFAIPEAARRGATARFSVPGANGD